MSSIMRRRSGFSSANGEPPVSEDEHDEQESLLDIYKCA
jgi:hypothetical protein